MVRSRRSGHQWMSVLRSRSDRDIRWSSVMAYWLLKTEPEEFSWDDQVKRGKKGEAWTGVRNFIARGNLKEMKKGDLCFFYHTGKEKQVVGIAEVIKENYPDPSAGAGEPWKSVDVIAVEPMPKPV